MSLIMRLNRVGQSLIKLNQSRRVCKHLFHSVPLTNILNSDCTSILVSRFQSPPVDCRNNLFSFVTYPNTNDPLLYADIDLACLKDLGLYIRGHCLGIVCLFDGVSDIFLFNLITGKLYSLPPSILLPTYNDQPSLESQTSAVGFGYDSKSKDLKVVRIVNYYHDYDYLYPNRVEVYDLSRNRWREVETRVTSNILWDPSYDMYHKGVYYWWALHKNNQILSFDFSKEVFIRIPVPESFGAWPVKYKGMGVWNGSIVLFHYPSSTREVKYFDIWAMKMEDAVSWSKIFTIGPLSGLKVKKPLLFVNSNLLLMATMDNQIISYNIHTKEFQNLLVQGYSFHAFIFANTFSSKSCNLT